ncbi:MAG: hypothetical protein ABIG87_01055, partial [Patescibacteria group bacterium]
MENKKFIKYFVILTGIILLPVFYVSAYNAEYTHPALTQETIKLFEVHNPDNIFTDSEKEIIERGSTKEDDPVYRCAFHFYDPIYERGFKGNL